MDWQNVTAEELLDALREVDWKAPRPLTEFISKFSPPKNHGKWTSRLKCNVYYYRTNYLVLGLLSFTLAFIRNPLALAAILVCSLAGLCLNDPFATGLSEVVLKVIRKIHPRTAQRIRARTGEQAIAPLRRGKKDVRIVGLPRTGVVLLLAGVGLFMVYRSAAILTLAWAIVFGVGLPLLHASFRSPNLKARLASAREEFRAVWRGYQTDGFGGDYSR